MKILTPGRMDYATALDLQNSLLEDLLAGRGEETLILLEHDPVYTIGRTRDQTSLGIAMPHPVFETNRGGQATYHGPGQLTGYPILDLNRRGKDLHLYLRFLESFLIELSATYGIQAERREGLTGVWVGERKLASLGVGIKKWISMHGFAINVTRESLEPFKHITPCGLTGVEITCFEREVGIEIDMPDCIHRAARLFETGLGTMVETQTP